MDIAEKTLQLKQDFDDVYESGQKSEYDRFWDNYQNNGNRRTYEYAFSGCAWTLEILKPKYPILFNPTNNYTCRSMFYRLFRDTDRGSGTTGYDISYLLKDIDFSQVINPANLFDNAKVTNISIDLSNATSLNRTFATGDGGVINEIRSLKITEKCTTFTNAFAYQAFLTTLIFTEDSVIACNGLDLSRSTSLSHKSLMSIINALKDYSEDTSGIKWAVTLGQTNLDKLTNEEKVIATEKGWTLA